jgi:hypothetical protein
MFWYIADLVSADDDFLFAGFIELDALIDAELRY